MTVTLCALLKVPVVAANDALVWPDGTVTLDGTESAVALLPSATTTELAAVWLSDTVQVLDALLPMVEGAQEIPVSCVGAFAVRLNDCDPPP